jgi:hypothetical protein
MNPAIYAANEPFSGIARRLHLLAWRFFQSMKALRHHDVTGNHEAVAPSRLFQNAKEQTAPRLRLQKGKSSITTEGDEVQKSVAVAAIQSGHDRSLCPKLVPCL